MLFFCVFLSGCNSLRVILCMPLPVSRDLIRIIKASGKADESNLSLMEHLKRLETRQIESVEFFFRACVVRLEEYP